MYYTHPGCRTSILGENREYCIRDFTVYLRSKSYLCEAAKSLHTSQKYCII